LSLPSLVLLGSFLLQLALVILILEELLLSILLDLLLHLRIDYIGLVPVIFLLLGLIELSKLIPIVILFLDLLLSIFFE